MKPCEKTTENTEGMQTKYRVNAVNSMCNESLPCVVRDMQGDDRGRGSQPPKCPVAVGSVLRGGPRVHHAPVQIVYFPDFI